MINTFYIIIGIINLNFVLILISARNPIHRIASLMSIFLTGSFIFILLDNYFLGLTYIIVYVGAIAILFLFVIMLIELPLVGLNNEINDKIKEHNSVLNFKIKNVNNFYNKNIKKQLTICNINKEYKTKNQFLLFFSLNDIIKNYSIYNISNQNKNLSSEKLPNISFKAKILIFIIMLTGSIDDNKSIIEIIYDKIKNFIINPKYTDIDIFNYYYSTWSIEFKNITDIENLGITIYLAYPLALILISITLWTVMVGIISICSPRR